MTGADGGFDEVPLKTTVKSSIPKPWSLPVSLTSIQRRKSSWLGATDTPVNWMLANSCRFDVALPSSDAAEGPVVGVTKSRAAKLTQPDARAAFVSGELPT